MTCLIEERIPVEVLGLILERLLDPPEDPYNYSQDELEFDDLRNARLVCRRWNLAASTHMFRDLALLHPDPEQAEAANFSKFTQLVASPTVQNAARCALIYSGPGNDDADFPADNAWKRWEEGEYEELVAAINCIANLPKLQGVHIVFSNRCVGDSGHIHPGYWGGGVEEPYARLSLLEAVFNAVRTRGVAHGPSNRTITSLTLENLQNMALPDDFLSSDAFTSVAKDVTELRLQIAHEFHDFGPDGDLELLERRTFEPWLQHTFLPIFTENLTSLHISFIENWGVAPGYFDGKNLSFPHLKTLTLSEFVIGHHDQFDWVLAQKSLETLRLRHCFIVSHLAFISRDPDQVQKWGTPTHDWKQHPVWAFGMHDRKRTFTFSGTWETVFNNIQTHPPHLVDFRMENPPEYRPCAKFNHPERMRRELTTMRYITLDTGLLPSPWITAKGRSGAMHFGNNDPAVLPEEQRTGEFRTGQRCKLNRALETLEGDTKSFRALVATVDKRRKEKGLEEINPQVFGVLPGNVMVHYVGE